MRRCVNRWPEGAVMLGQHSDVVDRFGSLPIGDLERGGNGQPHRLIAGATLRILPPHVRNRRL
jgi:hypothetical protein